MNIHIIIHIYRQITYNKNVDMTFSAHDSFLESGTLKIERLESQNN
jgi:hypothetical protein